MFAAAVVVVVQRNNSLIAQITNTRRVKSVAIASRPMTRIMDPFPKAFNGEDMANPQGPTNPTLLASEGTFRPWLYYWTHFFTGVGIERGFVPGPAPGFSGRALTLPRPTPALALWALPSPIGAVPASWYGLNELWAGFRFPDYSSTQHGNPEHLRATKAAADAADVQRNQALSRLQNLVATVVAQPDQATTPQLQFVQAGLLNTKSSPALIAALQRVNAELAKRGTLPLRPDQLAAMVAAGNNALGVLQFLQGQAPADP